MVKHYTIGRWVLSLSTNARRPWGHIHTWRCRETTARSWIWGRLSIGLEDWTAEVYAVCAECGSGEIGEVSAGDEGWTVCSSCRAIEQGYLYVNLKEWEKAN